MGYKSKFFQQKEKDGEIPASNSKTVQTSDKANSVTISSPAPMRKPTEPTFSGAIKENNRNRRDSGVRQAYASRPTALQPYKAPGAKSDEELLETAYNDLTVQGAEIQGEQTRLLEMQNELESVQKQGEELDRMGYELFNAYRGVSNLEKQYRQTGDETTYNAYEIAMAEYNAMAEAYQQAATDYQKTYDAAGVDKYNVALAKHQKNVDQHNRDIKKYEENRNLYLEDHPEIKYADASYEEVEAAIAEQKAELSSIIRGGGAVGWDAYHRVEKRIEGLQALRSAKVGQTQTKWWGSSAGEFFEGIGTAMQTGSHDWFVQMGGLHTMATATLAGVLADVRWMTGASEDSVLGKWEKRLIEKNDKVFEEQKTLQIGQDTAMTDVLEGTGKIDGWIIEQFRGLGAMMSDIYFAGMAGAASGTYGATTGAAQGSATKGVLAARAAGGGMIAAAEKGYSPTEQVLSAISTGALEYAAESMFGGNPIYGGETGWVTEAVTKVVKNPTVQRLLYSKVFDIMGEGFEEVFTLYTQPMAEALITWSPPEMPTVKEAAEAFAGGLFLSLMVQGASVAVTEASGKGARSRKMSRTIRDADAVQDLVNKGLAADPRTEAYLTAQKMQKKLDAGKTLTVREIGQQMFANQKAIDAGLLADQEVPPSEIAPEGALQDPEEGFYGIQTRQAEDDKTTYQLVQVAEDGSIKEMGQPAEDLLAAKLGAEIMGANVRHIGTIESLKRSAEELEREEAAETESGTLAAEPITEQPRQAIQNEETPGLVWAGGENTEGAYQYEGTEEGYLGAGQSQGWEQRGYEAERSGRGEEGRRPSDTVRRAQEASRVRNYATAAELPRVSLGSLGFNDGSDAKNLQVLPKDASPTVAEAYELAENAGVKLYVVTGKLWVKENGQEHEVDSIYENGVICARADSLNEDLINLVEHEIFHDRVAKTPGLRKRLIQYVWDNYYAEETQNRLDKYYETYQELYSHRAKGKKLEELIFEELLADAYAELDRYGDGTLEGLSEVVQEQAWARGGRKSASAGAFTGIFTGRTYNERQATLLSQLSVSELQNAIDAKGNLSFNMIGLGGEENADTRQAWIDAGLTYEEDGQLYVDENAVLDERDRRRENRNQSSEGTRFFFGGRNANAADTEELDTKEDTSYNEQTETAEGGVNYGRENGDDLHRRGAAPIRGEQGSAGFGIYRGNQAGIPAAGRTEGHRGKIVHREDSEGRRLTDDEAARLEGTAIVDEDGHPIAVYHFTPEMDFETFERGDVGFHFGMKQHALQRAKDKKATSGRIFRAYLNIKNPVRVDKDIMGWHAAGTALKLWTMRIIDYSDLREIEEMWQQGREYNDPAARRLREILGEKRYDGIVYQNGFEGDGESYIAFRDEQIVKNEIIPVNDRDGVMSEEDGKGNRFSAATKSTMKREDILADLRQILARGGTAAELREYVTALEQEYGEDTIRDEMEPSEEIDPAQEIVRAAHRENMSVEDYLVQNAELYEYDGEWNEEARRAMRIERGGTARFSAPRRTPPSESAEDRARDRAERQLARGIGEIFSVPVSEVHRLRDGIVHEFMEQYQRTGEINAEMLQDMASNAFAQGLIIDDEFYRNYKHIKDHLRTQKITIAPQDRNDIADYALWKKKTYNVLRIVNEGGLPVDSAYMELREMAPELFPEDITHPADQLMQMYDVAKRIRRVEIPLERVMGDDSEGFFEYTRGQTEKLLERVLTKYADSVQLPKRAKSEAEKPEPAAAREPIGTPIDSPDYVRPQEAEGIEWAGQYEVGGWTPEPVAEEELTAEERARRGSMRDWVRYVLSGELTPEEFAERMRRAAPSDNSHIIERMIRDHQAQHGAGVNLYRDPEMSEEEYEVLNNAWLNRKKREPQKPLYEMTPQELIISKRDFSSTPAMDRLGIKIDGSVTRYRQTEQLIAYEQAAQKAQRALNRRIEKLLPTDKEKALAAKIADGTITDEDLNSANVNIDIVTELADYMAAVNSFNEDRLQQRRDEINVANLRLAKVMLQDRPEYDPTLPGVLEMMTKVVMNERTPERVVKQIFGEDMGQKIYDTYFRPVWVNGTEMYRFENRMKDRVREFKDASGNLRKLTEDERAMAQRLLEGEAVEQRMKELENSDADMAERVKDAAQNVNNGVDWLDTIREHQIDEDHTGLVQAYADYMDMLDAVAGMDETILENAVAEYKKIYNEMYEAINDFLTSHGYAPIGFIEGYAPHFQKSEVQHGLFGALRALGVENEKVSSLPAAIAGRTADFKPNMKWNPHMLSREGNKTDYDIQVGFERYLHYVAEMFYHTDDVMRIRQAVNWMRAQYAGEEIKDEINDAMVDQYKDAKWKREFLLSRDLINGQNTYDDRKILEEYQRYVDGLFARAEPENLQKYSEFVTWLDNYANIVAGKQSLADRGIEFGGGREALNWGQRLMRTFASVNVAGNLSSVLNQSAQLALLQSELGIYLEQAAVDIARGTAAKENFAERSDLLTDRRGIEKLTMDNTERVISAMFKPAEMADRLVSMLAVRGAYLKALDEGKSPEQALREADDFGRRVMGSRMKGARPIGFESKRYISQMLHIFQTEASNTFDYMLLSDHPQAVKQIAKTKGKKAAARYAAATTLTYLISAFLLNSITDELYGGSPAPFDLFGWLLNFVASGWEKDDEDYLKTIADNGWEKMFGERLFGTEPINREDGFQWEGATDDLVYNILGDVPYVRNAMGVMGLGDQSMPTVGINEFAGFLRDAAGTLWNQMVHGEEETGLTWAGAAAETTENLLSAAALVVPGGRQAQKTMQGVRAMVQGGKVKGWGENARMQYPIERTAANWIKAVLFGPAGLDETDAFYAGGQALSAGQTQNLADLEEKGIDRFLTYGMYEEFRDINKHLTGSEASEAKRNVINALPLTDEQKLDVYSTIVMSDTDENYEKRVSEFEAMLDAGLSWDDVTRAHNAYAAINDEEGPSASEKATDFAAWVDEQGWTQQQKETVEARWKFWSQVPAEATNYNRFTDAGLSVREAKQTTELLAGLKPRDGKEMVTTNQKVLALENSRLSPEDKKNAIVSLDPDRRDRMVEVGVPVQAANNIAAELMIAEAENGDDELSYLERARIIVNNAGGNDAAMDAMSTVLTDSSYAKLQIASRYGLRAETWVRFKETWQERYGDDGVSQEKVEKVLNGMNMTDRERAALWQIANKSWKPYKNPYDSSVANSIYDAMN